MTAKPEAPLDCDVLIVGAGIAGASLAWHLGAQRRVVLLERESLPGAHATGRSAAIFSELYGDPVVRALTRASRAFLETPPPGFSETPLLSPRGILHLARDDQRGLLADLARDAEVSRVAAQTLSAQETRRRVPILRESYVSAAVLERDAKDIDVHALHQGYLRGAKSAGVQLCTDAAFLRAERTPTGWSVEMTQGRIAAAILVDAAGAWADAVARDSGVAPLGLAPCRRTMAVVPLSGPVRDWPFVVDIGEAFYFKPESGGLLLSPCDETPSPPGDAAPDEIDIAIGIDRVQQAADIEVRRVLRAWAGLRSLLSDRLPAVGFDPRVPGFFWLAGQGGFGIQTAPALGALGAALILERALPDFADEHCIDPTALVPGRFAQTGEPRTDDGRR